MRKLTAIAVFALAISAGAPAQPPGGDREVPVMTARAEKGAFVEDIRLTGTVQAFRTSELASEMDGVVDEVLVEDGDKVTQGTALVRLRVLPYELEYQRAEARALAAEATLAELEAGLRPEEVAIARSNVTEAKAQLANAEREFRRFEQLLNERTASEQEFDAAKQRFLSRQAMLESAEATLAMAEQGPRAEAVARARAEAMAARADAKFAKDHLDRATIRAPYDGWVTRRHVDPGSWVGKGDTVASIQSDGKVFVRVNAPEGFFNRISVGDQTEFTFDAAPGESFVGTVNQIIPRADITSRAFPVRLLVDNSEGRLAPGMLARGVIKPPASGQLVIIPKDAIVVRGPQPMVFRVRREEGRAVAESVEVQTGRYFGTAVEVNGLEPDDEVVIRGNERLMDGAVLRLNQFITNPDMARIN